jgi:hypothetical protein
MKVLGNYGHDSFTRGEDTQLSLIAQNDDTAESIAGVVTLETVFMGSNGQRVVIPDGDHTVVEAAGVDTGKFTVDLAADVSALIQLGKKVKFSTTITDTGTSTQVTYWGEIEVRRPLGDSI